jgi:hypothetical protein
MYEYKEKKNEMEELYLMALILKEKTVILQNWF